MGRKVVCVKMTPFKTLAVSVDDGRRTVYLDGIAEVALCEPVHSHGYMYSSSDQVDYHGWRVEIVYQLGHRTTVFDAPDRWRMIPSYSSYYSSFGTPSDPAAEARRRAEEKERIEAATEKARGLELQDELEARAVYDEILPYINQVKSRGQEASND